MMTIDRGIQKSDLTEQHSGYPNIPCDVMSHPYLHVTRHTDLPTIHRHSDTSGPREPLDPVIEDPARSSPLLHPYRQSFVQVLQTAALAILASAIKLSHLGRNAGLYLCYARYNVTLAAGS
jgi:hypothetical protein